MRKLNSTLVAISWTLTIIFGIIFFVSWINAANTQTAYGSLATSAPSFLGRLIANGLIPSLLWLITFLSAPKIKGGDPQKPTKEGYRGGYSGGHNDYTITNEFSAGNNSEYNNDHTSNRKGDDISIYINK